MALKQENIKQALAEPVMKAKDLFDENTEQVFSVRTGDRIGYISQAGFSQHFNGTINPATEDPEPEVKDENQLNLF